MKTLQKIESENKAYAEFKRQEREELERQRREREEKEEQERQWLLQQREERRQQVLADRVSRRLLQRQRDDAPASDDLDLELLRLWTE